MKFHIDKTAESTMCRMYRVENETISRIVSECKMLVEKEYKKRHENVCRYFHRRLYKKQCFKGALIVRA